MEQSETSDNRPYLTTLNISSFNTHLLQENFDDDENVIHHQPTTPQQPSQITQDTTESLQDTLINPPNTSTVTDSDARQVSIHDITENTNNLFNQEDPSTLFTMNTIDTQPLQTHQMIQQNYDHPHPHLKLLLIVLLKLHLNKFHLIHFKLENTLQRNPSFKQLPSKTIYSDNTIYSCSIFNI